MTVLISMAIDWSNWTTAVDVDNAKLKYNAKTNDIRLLSTCERVVNGSIKWKESKEKCSDFYRIILHDFISVNLQTCRARTLLPSRKCVWERECRCLIVFWSHRIPVYGSIVSILIINRTLNWVLSRWLSLCFVLLFVSIFVSRRLSQPVDYCIYGSHIGFLCVHMKTSVRFCNMCTRCEQTIEIRACTRCPQRTRWSMLSSASLASSHQQSGTIPNPIIVINRSLI